MTPADPLAPFAAALARLRRERGLTRYALARLAGVPEIALSKMERGTREPRLGTLAKLAGALGVGLDEVAGRG